MIVSALLLHHFLPQFQMLLLQRLPLPVELFEFEIRLPHLVRFIRDAPRDQLPQPLAPIRQPLPRQENILK